MTNCLVFWLSDFTLHHILVLPDVAVAGVCVLCSSMSSQQFQQFKIPNKNLEKLSSPRCKKWRILIFPPFSRRACWRGSRGRWRSPAGWSRSPRPPPSSPRAGSTGCPDLAWDGGVMYLSIVWHLLSLYSCTWQGFSLINGGLQL